MSIYSIKNTYLRRLALIPALLVWLPLSLVWAATLASLQELRSIPGGVAECWKAR